MTFATYLLAAAAEISGCYAFWAWLRLGAKPYWELAGLLALVAFAVLLTRTEPQFAGRSFAAYGGIYIAASLMWLWLVEGVRPTPSDLIGAGLCLAGAAVIVLAHRA